MIFFFATTIFFYSFSAHGDIACMREGCSGGYSFVYTSRHCRRWRLRMEVKIVAGSLFAHCKKNAYFYSVTAEKWLVVSLPNFVITRKTFLSIPCMGVLIIKIKIKDDLGHRPWGLSWPLLRYWSLQWLVGHCTNPPVYINGGGMLLLI